MPSLSMAWRTADPAGELIALIDGQAHAQYAEALGAAAHVIVVAPWVTSRTRESLAESVRAGLSVPALACLDLLVVPAERRLITIATEAITHILRLADATLKPLGPEPDPVYLAPGDAYVALIPGRQPLTSETRLAAARFIHLRDDFNADTLAVNLLKHLLADERAGGQPPPSLGALVIECR